VKRELGERGDDRRRAVARDPPGDVVVGGMAVCVLEGQLCLADAAEPVDRRHLGLGGVRGRMELRMQHLQKRLAAGEGRISRGKVGDLRSVSRKARPLAGPLTGTFWERWLQGRLQPALADPLQQAGPGGLLVGPDEVDVHPGPQHTWRLDLLDPHRQQESFAAGRVSGKGDPPLRLPIGRL
jgi:hypothetical protein